MAYPKSLHAKRPRRPSPEERPDGKNRFARYETEHDGRLRKASVRGDKRMERLVSALERSIALQKNLAWALDIADHYDGTRTLVDFAIEALADVAVPPKDVEKFSLAMPRLVRAGFLESHMSPFFNALMEMASLPRMRLHSVNELLGIGMDNDRIIEVNGDAGRLAGDGMKRGLIHVKGSVGDSAGCQMSGGTLLIEGDAEAELGGGMAGGLIHLKGDAGIYCGSDMTIKGTDTSEEPLIIVDGNARDCLGSRMKAGTIVVAGNAGENVGEGMEGGCIYIKGSFKSLSRKIGRGYIQVGSDRIVYDDGYCDKKKS